MQIRRPEVGPGNMHLTLPPRLLTRTEIRNAVEWQLREHTALLTFCPLPLAQQPAQSCAELSAVEMHN